MIRKYTINTSRREVSVSEGLDATQVERRIELAGQGIALEAAAEHEMPGRVTIRAKPARTETTKPGALDTWDVSVISTDGEVLAERKVLLSHVFLYETQALVDTLAPLGLFRAGEEALSLFRDDDAEPMAAQLEFSYRLPQVEPEPDERDHVVLSRRATKRIAQLMREDDGDGFERKGFVVGTLDARFIPRVEEILVPDEPENGEPSASREHVDIDPADWLWAQTEVERMGPPLQILGVFHTQPGSLKPSMTDIHLFQWSGSASSVFLVACEVQGQPLVAAYRFETGRLVQVDIRAEQAPSNREAVSALASEEDD